MVRWEDLYKSYVIGDIKNTNEEPNVDDWFTFMDTLPVPKDVFEESFNKYLCRMYYFKKGKTFILNAASFLVLIPITVRMLLTNQQLPENQNDLLVLEEQSDVDYRDVFPYELKDRYREFITIKREKNSLGALGKEAKSLYMHTWLKYWNHPYFLMWVMKELSVHSAYIKKYNPKALVFYINERNVASPILTKLYEDNGRKLISFMHGEYLLQLIQGYMRFSTFYIWDKSYVYMFKEKLKCSIEEYIVYKPQKMIKKWAYDQIEPCYFLTYYFCAENKQTLDILNKVLRVLVNAGKKVKLRPHPRVSHLELIRKSFNGIEIEDPKEVSIRESLEQTEYVCGLNTTVLLEGFIEGRKIVIDDLSNVKGYLNLKKRYSLALSRKHILLSEIIARYGSII